MQLQYIALTLFFIVLINSLKYGTLEHIFERFFIKIGLKTKSSELLKDKLKWNREYKRKASSLDIDKISKSDNDKRPNIVLMIYDGRRQDDFDFADKDGRNDMPFIKSLSNNSIFFRNAIACNCWTIPSYGSFFSGFPSSILDNDSVHDVNYQTTPNNFYTLAEILSRAGYRTMNVADFHVFLYSGSENGNQENSLSRGFELVDVVGKYPKMETLTNFTTEGGEIVSKKLFEIHSYKITDSEIQLIKSYNDKKLDPMSQYEYDYDKKKGVYYPTIESSYNNSSFFNDRHDYILKKILENDEGRPFFLSFNLHFCDIAIPDPSQFAEWALHFLLLNSSNMEKSLPIPNEGDEFSNYYSSCLRSILGIEEWFVKHSFDNRFYDYTFKRFHQALKESELFENTVFIVTSDHGFGFGENGEPRYLHSHGRPYDYLLNVPIIIDLPKGHKYNNLQGQYNSRVSLLDLFYTIIDLAGLNSLSVKGINIYEKSEDQDYKFIEKTDLSFGESLFFRINKSQFSDFIISEQYVLPFFYNDDPYFEGPFASIFSDDKQLIFSDATRKCILDLNAGRNIFSKNNFRKYIFLLNPLNLFRSRKKRLMYFFSHKSVKPERLYNYKEIPILISEYYQFKKNSDRLKKLLRA